MTKHLIATIKEYKIFQQNIIFIREKVYCVNIHILVNLLKEIG